MKYTYEEIVSRGEGSYRLEVPSLSMEELVATVDNSFVKLSLLFGYHVYSCFNSEQFDDIIKKLSEKIQEIGKYVFVHSKEESSTRLYLSRMSRFMSAETKQGWLDMFTLSTKPCDEGYYIAKIISFREDRDGYPIMVVEPEFQFEGNDEESLQLLVMAKSSKMHSLYANDAAPVWLKTRGNTGALHDKYGDYDKMFDGILNESISEDNIKECLDTRTPEEQLVYDARNHYKELQIQYPLIAKKVKNLYEQGVYDLSDFFTDKLFRYRELDQKVPNWNESIEHTAHVSFDFGPLMIMVNDVMSYYDNIHKAQKAAKKAVRKSAKQ